VVPEGRTSLFGVPWTVADTDLAFMIQRLNLNGFELPPAVRRFVDTQWQRPSVQEWVNHKRLPYRPY
jgi:glutathione S-transferase